MGSLCVTEREAELLQPSTDPEVQRDGLGWDALEHCSPQPRSPELWLSQCCFCMLWFLRLHRDLERVFDLCLLNVAV